MCYVLTCWRNDEFGCISLVWSWSDVGICSSASVVSILSLSSLILLVSYSLSLSNLSSPSHKRPIRHLQTVGPVTLASGTSTPLLLSSERNVRYNLQCSWIWRNVSTTFDMFSRILATIFSGLLVLWNPF